MNRDAVIEECAVAAWNHYMDLSRKHGISPTVMEKWCAATAIRALKGQSEPPSVVETARKVDLDLSRVLHELAGAASLCWRPKPDGVFDSEQALAFVEAAIDELRKPLRAALEGQSQQDGFDDSKPMPMERAEGVAKIADTYYAGQSQPRKLTEQERTQLFCLAADAPDKMVKFVESLLAGQSTPADALMLEWLWENCRIIYFPKGGKYPIEHQPFAVGGKDGRLMIEAEYDAALKAQIL